MRAEANDAAAPQDFKSGKGRNFCRPQRAGTGASTGLSALSESRPARGLVAYDDKYWGIGEFRSTSTASFIYADPVIPATRVSALIGGEVNFPQDDATPLKVCCRRSRIPICAWCAARGHTIFFGVNMSCRQNTYVSESQGAKSIPCDNRVRHASNMAIDRNW